MSGLQTVNDCFLKACWSKKVEKVKAAITLGCDINCVGGTYNRTGLIYSAGYFFNEDIMNTILQHKSVNVNKTDDLGATAIQHACMFNNPLAVEILGRVAGMEVNRKDNDGETAVNIAAERGNIECLVELLKIPGVDLNIKDDSGDTAVLTAFKVDNKDVLKLLLTTPGVDLTITDKNNKTLEQLARDENAADVLKMIPGTLEHQVEVLAQTVQNLQKSKKAPECPVCFHQLLPPKQMFQCVEGHIVCGTCRPKIQICPTCRGAMTGRAHAFEQFLREN